jgi:predicted metal-dependent hydrolase
MGIALLNRPASFRRSARARYLRIKVTLHEGVVVTIPPGVNEATARAFLDHHDDWVRRTLDRLRRQAGLSPTCDPLALPEWIELRAMDRRLAVEYRPTGGATRVRHQGECLIVSGNPADGQAARAGLKRWLLREGRARLPEWLDRLSRETGLRYRRVSIRAQRGRWGSCSSSGSISLNCKLLFLPTHLVRYVLLHELAHTVHLNHSPRYWVTVAGFEADYRSLERELRQAGPLVPSWVEHAP